MSSLPLCSGPSCGKAAVSECARCHAAAYCSADCQKADWPLHLKHCKPPSAQAQSLASALQSILAKWALQRTFVRFLDGNRANAAPANAVPVGLRESLAGGNADAWAVDWDRGLSAEEASLVRNPSYRAALLLAQLPGDAARSAAAGGGGGSGGAAAAGKDLD